MLRISLLRAFYSEKPLIDSLLMGAHFHHVDENIIPSFPSPCGIAHRHRRLRPSRATSFVTFATINSPPPLHPLLLPRVASALPPSPLLAHLAPSCSHYPTGHPHLNVTHPCSPVLPLHVLLSSYLRHPPSLHRPLRAFLVKGGSRTIIIKDKRKYKLDNLGV